MANFKAPCEWCEFGQVFNGQLGHLYKVVFGSWRAGVWALTPEGVRFWGVTGTGTGIFRFLAACSSPR